jgi:hypothetical protein
MFAFFASPQYMPCPDCGASLNGEEPDDHRCDPVRWVDYQMFQLRNGIARFELDFGAYLASLQGRFESWYAARQRQAA